MTEITFISLNDRLTVCTSSSIEGIKVLNMTIYKSLEHEITRRGMIRQRLMVELGRALIGELDNECEHTPRHL